MLKKLIKLNLDDLWLYIGVEGGLFLLLEIVICCVMRFARPGDSVTVSNVLFPIVAGFIALIAGISHVGVTFEQALRFGQTRRRGLGLVLGLMSFEAAFGMALGAVLSALERLVCPYLWAWAAGMEHWTRSLSAVKTPAYPPDYTGPVLGSMFENMAGEWVPVPENTLIVNTFTLDWYWWLLALAIGLGGGIIAGALVQRFGSKGGWIVWGACMAPTILGQLLPWRTHTITDWLFPLLGILFAAGLIWSVWSMLHAVVRQ